MISPNLYKAVTMDIKNHDTLHWSTCTLLIKHVWQSFIKIPETRWSSISILRMCLTTTTPSTTKPG